MASDHTPMKQFTLFLTALLLSFSPLFAQEKTDVNAALAAVGLTQDDLNHIADGTKAMNNYAYKIKSVEENSFGDKTEKIMSYDPRKAVGERWTLISVNGDDPTEEQITSFNKEKNDPDDHIEEQNENLVEEDQTWIERDNESELIIGYKFNKKHLHHSQKILKHFRARVSIDKQKKDIKYVELYSFEPFKMLLVMKISDMDIRMDFKQVGEGDELVTESKTHMKLSMFGQEGTATVTQTYYDYEKVL